MKRLLCALAFGVSGLAGAGPLEDADKFLAAKAYDKALPIYASLAEAGNAEAQFRLGEMHWYGEGTAVDMKAADAWMRKAAARGHAGAVESLEIMKQREARAADIAYWTSGQNGDGVAAVRYDCPAPVIPEKSSTGAEIKQTSNAYLAWQQCYNRFVENVNAVTPAGKGLPPDVARLLTPQEAEEAARHLGRADGAAIAQARQDATRYSAHYAAWQAATERQVMAENRARKQEYEILAQRRRERESQHRAMPPVMPATPVTPPTGR